MMIKLQGRSGRKIHLIHRASHKPCIIINIKNEIPKSQFKFKKFIEYQLKGYLLFKLFDMCDIAAILIND